MPRYRPCPVNKCARPSTNRFGDMNREQGAAKELEVTQVARSFRENRTKNKE